MTSSDTTPRKPKFISRLVIILAAVMLLGGAAGLTSYLVRQRNERVAVEALSILETQTYISPTPTASVTPSITPTPSASTSAPATASGSRVRP